MGKYKLAEWSHILPLHKLISKYSQRDKIKKPKKVFNLSRMAG
jgi:hypothetical protein